MYQTRNMEHFETPKNKWSELNLDGLVVKETEQNEKHLVYSISQMVRIFVIHFTYFGLQ